MKRPRILLIGRSGQVAWELRRTLACLGELFVASRNTGDLQVDLLDPREAGRLVENIRPDWLVNAAAYTAVDRAEEELELAMAINAEAPGVLAEAARRIGALTVHYSTDYVFDGKALMPYREEMDAKPVNVYGASKYAGEQAIAATGAHHLILRTSWVYASRGRNFVRSIRALARERDELRVVADQCGSPTWARHIAEATAQILVKLGCNRDLWTQHSGVYHLSAAGETTWFEFAKRIVDFQQKYETTRIKLIEPINTIDYPAPAQRPLYSVLDNQRVKETFGIRIPNWELGLEQLFEELTAVNI